MAPKVDDPLTQSWFDIVGWHQREWEGRFDDALEHLARWQGAIERSNNIFLVAGAKWLEAATRASKGDYNRALPLLAEVLQICERVGGMPFWHTRALNTVGFIRGDLQDFDGALDWNRRGVEEARQAGFPDPEVESNARLNLGDNLTALGQLDEAEEQFRHVERIVRDPKPEQRLDLWRYSQHLFHSYGELFLELGDHDKALSYADECLELAEPAKSVRYVAKGRRLRAQVLLAKGDLEGAESELNVALGAARKLGNPPQLWQTHRAGGDLLLAQGDREAAREAYGAALRAVQDVGAELEDQKLREILAGSRLATQLAEAVEPTQTTARSTGSNRL